MTLWHVFKDFSTEPFPIISFAAYQSNLYRNRHELRKSLEWKNIPRRNRNTISTQLANQLLPGLTLSLKPKTCKHLFCWNIQGIKRELASFRTDTRHMVVHFHLTHKSIFSMLVAGKRNVLSPHLTRNLAPDMDTIQREVSRHYGLTPNKIPAEQFTSWIGWNRP